MRRFVLLLGLVVLCSCGVQDRIPKLEAVRDATREENKRLKQQKLRLQWDVAALKEEIKRRAAAKRRAEEAAEEARNQIDILFFGKESDRPLTPEEQKEQQLWKEFMEWREKNTAQ